MKNWYIILFFTLFQLTSSPNATAAASVCLLPEFLCPFTESVSDGPEIQCPDDLTIDCGMENSPSVTGTPGVLYDGPYTLSYSDVVQASPCGTVITRTWVVETYIGDYVTCTQTITTNDTTPPVIQSNPGAILNCASLSDWAVTATDNCDPDPVIIVSYDNGEWVQAQPCVPGMYRTQTQGGWGTNPSGNNPGTYLAANFSAAFPNGLTIGCGNRTLKLTSAQAVRDFLPSGTSPALLPQGQLVNPGGSYSNVFAGQLVAATLSTTFDAYDEQFGSGYPDLGALTMTSGTFSGMTVSELLSIANQIIGGCITGYTPSQVSSALASLNENFVDGTVNNGFIDCAGGLDCFLSTTITFTATDACGNSSEVSFPVVLNDNDIPEFTGVPSELHVECGQVPGSDEILTAGCFAELLEVQVTETYFSGACYPTIERVYTLNDQCGNASTFTQYIFVHDTTAPVFAEQPSDASLLCGDAIPSYSPVVTDNCGQAPEVTLVELVTTAGCIHSIHRTWTAVDACGNSTSVSQTITITDDEGPTASGFEPVIHQSCGELPSADQVTFTDACGAVVSVEMDVQSIGSDCSEIITRTWTATDVCGNTTVLVQHIYLTDDVPPVISQVPAELDVDCGAALPEWSPQAIDNCSEPIIEYSELEVSGDNACRQVMRTWTARDACGNEATTSQLVTFTDNLPPVLSGVPANTLAGCGDVPQWPVVTASDNCDEQVTVQVGESMTQTSCGMLYTRTWTASDACGNTTIAQQVIDLSDNAPPQFSGPAELTLTCNEFDSYTIDVSDDCTVSPALTYSDEIDPGDCAYTVNRTWTATDQCGNESVFVQTLNVTDTQPPVFVSVPPSYTISCEGQPLYEEPQVIDGCSDVALVMNETQLISGCTTTIIRTWTATDACDNSSFAEQTITITDTTAPVIHNVPQSYSVACENYIYPEIPGDVSATDNCGTPDLEFSETLVPGACPSAFQLIRTWTAMDDCGNSTIAQQVISVADLTPPVFGNLPEDFFAACGDVPAPPSLTATDNCSDVSVTYVEQVLSGGCPIIQRIWTATDACGLSTSVMQQVHLIDDEPPLLQGIPPGGPVSCNNIPPVPDAYAVDNCDDVVDVSISETIIGSGCEFLLIRTFIAEDDCGNATIVSQTFQVTDEAPPVFVNPQPSVTLQCSQLPMYQGPNVSDDCGSNVILSFTDVTNGSGCSYTIQRTYVATDLCGNSASFTQSIHVVDTTPPVITGVPLSTTVNCGNIPSPAQPTALDACSGIVPVQFSQQQIGSGCGVQLVRTWTAFDACGNMAMATQMILVIDLVPPVLTGVPSSISLQCGDVIPAPAIVTATDNCQLSGFQPTVEYAQNISVVACGQIITRTWSATDACGNQSTATQTISLVDNEGPVFSSVPQNASVSCGAIPDAPLLTATDNCSGSVTVNFMEEVQTAGCPYSIVRTWIASDACGNTTIATQTITVSDDEAPVLQTPPLNATVDCNDIPVAIQLMANDNCAGEFPATLVQTVIPGECSYSILRVWTATDHCGNTSVAQQTLTVVDTQPPVFYPLPYDIEVECGEEFDSFEPQVFDCSAVEVDYSEFEMESDCVGTHQLMQVWTATDACGNASQVLRKVSFDDTQAPVLSGEPEWVDVTCGEIPPVPVITAYDVCEGDTGVDFTETISWNGSGQEGCTLTDATNFFSQVAVWLPNLPGLSDNWVFGAEGGSMVRDEIAGTAVISGTVYNTSNPAYGWNINLVLANERNWSQWSALTRSYKNDMNLAGTHYLDWSYFELQPGSTLTGVGALSGSTLQLTHAPWHFYYGFQLGVAANNRNANYGISGWFSYTGVVQGESRSGVGDLFADVSCCPDHEIVRTWTAQDCSGNATTYTQVIAVSGQPIAQAFQLPPTESAYYFDVTGSTDRQFTIQFEMVESGQVDIQVHDEMGRMTTAVFSGHADAGTRYTVRIPKDGLTTGVYVFTLVHPLIRMSDREVVIR